ncbi:MAG: acyltransferase [Clostridia bacterium]|nr:acyltransferase [Clostridia bacterium]
MCRFIYKLAGKIRRAAYRIFWAPIIKGSFAKCGKAVTVPRGCRFSGIENIHVGNNVSFGVGTTVLTTKAKLYIGNDVMFAPNVVIVTGDHRIDIPGRAMASVRDDEKLPENDMDVVIEDDVWLGANVTVLKGVTIHTGSVISAGAVVTRDVEPYSIVGGVPARFIRKRFED